MRTNGMPDQPQHARASSLLLLSLSYSPMRDSCIQVGHHISVGASRVYLYDHLSGAARHLLLQPAAAMMS